MSNHNESYDRYRQDADQIAVGQRAAEEALNWESCRQRARERGTLDSLESEMRKLFRMWVRIEQERGKSRRDARLVADERMADLRWLVATEDPPQDAVALRMHHWRQLASRSALRKAASTLEVD